MIVKEAYNKVIKAFGLINEASPDALGQINAILSVMEKEEPAVQEAVRVFLIHYLKDLPPKLFKTIRKDLTKLRTALLKQEAKDIPFIKLNKEEFVVILAGTYLIDKSFLDSLPQTEVTETIDEEKEEEVEKPEESVEEK